MTPDQPVVQSPGPLWPKVLLGLCWVVLLAIGLWGWPQLEQYAEQQYQPPAVQVMVPRIITLGEETPVWFQLFHPHHHQVIQHRPLKLELSNDLRQVVFRSQGFTDIHGMWQLSLPQITADGTLRLKLWQSEPSGAARPLLDIPLKTSLPAWWHLRTDKPAYRPGDAVQVIAFGQSKQAELLAHQALQVHIRGPQQQHLTIPLNTNNQGYAQQAFRLNQEVPAGTYQVQLFKAQASAHRVMAQTSLQVVRATLATQAIQAQEGLVIIPLTTAIVPDLPQSIRLAVYYPDGQPVRKGWVRCFEKTALIQNGLAEFTLTTNKPILQARYYATDEQGQLKQGSLSLPLATAGWLAEQAEVNLASSGFVRLKIAVDSDKDQVFYAFGQGPRLLYQGQKMVQRGSNEIALACAAPCPLDDKWLRLHMASKPEIVHWFALGNSGNRQQDWLPLRLKQPLRVGMPLQLESVPSTRPFAPQWLTVFHHNKTWPLQQFQPTAHQNWFHDSVQWPDAGHIPFWITAFGLAVLWLLTGAAGVPLLVLYRGPSRLKKVSWQPSAKLLRDAYHVVWSAEFTGFALLMAVGLLIALQGRSPLLWVVLLPPLLAQTLTLKRQYQFLALSSPALPVLLLFLWLVSVLTVSLVGLAMPGLLPAWLLWLTLLWWIWAYWLQKINLLALFWRPRPWPYWLLSGIIVITVLLLCLWRQPLYPPPQHADVPLNTTPTTALLPEQIAMMETASRAKLQTRWGEAWAPGISRLPLQLTAPESPGVQQLQVLALDVQGGLQTMQIPFAVQPDVYCQWELPPFATLGDRLETPVTCLNPLPEPQPLSAQVAGNGLADVILPPAQVLPRTATVTFAQVGSQTLSMTYRRHGETVTLNRDIYVRPVLAQVLGPLQLLQEYPRVTGLVVGEEIPVSLEIAHTDKQPRALALQIGIPSGYEPLLDTLQSQASQRWFQSIRQRAGVIDLQTRPLLPNTPLRFHYRLRNQIAGQVQVPPVLLWRVDQPQAQQVHNSGLVLNSHATISVTQD